MSAGIQASQTINDINGTAGGIARELNALMIRIQNFEIFLAATDLKVAPYLLASADEATIKSAFTDLDQLRQVYQGLATRTPAYDYRSFAKSIYGFGQ